jgi:predicted CDP-diglyceride synthetase/phosphatidate cytidylyltransferase
VGPDDYGLLHSYAPALLLLKIPGFAGQSLPLMIYMLIVVQLSDVLQYVFGKLLSAASAPRTGAPMIEGHGGMLDRLDSVSFAAPVFFHLTRYFFARG